MRRLDLRPLAVGGVLVIGLLIGGSSVRGMPTNFIVQGLCLLLLPLIADRERESFYPIAARLLLLGIGLIFLLQLLPIAGLFRPSVSIGGLVLPAPVALTVDLGRTLQALLFVLPLVVVFLVLGRFSENDFNRLLPFLLLGVILNLAFAVVQFTASNTIVAQFLPYLTAGGFFANENHFGALLFVGIPFVVYQFVVIKRPLSSLFVVGLMVFVGFATRSIAGALLSLGCALVSYALVANLPARWRLMLFLTALAGAIALSFNPGNVLEIRGGDPLDRTSIFANTLNGIGHYLPLGAGFGTFDLVYPQFEAAADIRTSFVNHAHNEYLELLLEGGIPAAIALCFYASMLIWATITSPPSPLRMAALCGLGFLLIHSFVDYPVRTTGLAMVFVVLNAVIFTRSVGAPAAAFAPNSTLRVKRRRKSSRLGALDPQG